MVGGVPFTEWGTSSSWEDRSRKKAGVSHPFSNHPQAYPPGIRSFPEGPTGPFWYHGQPPFPLQPQGWAPSGGCAQSLWYDTVTSSITNKPSFL